MRKGRVTRLNGERESEEKIVPSRSLAYNDDGRGERFDGADGESAVQAMTMRFDVFVINECPPMASRTCTGTGPILRNRTGVDRVPVHRNTGTCTSG